MEQFGIMPLGLTWAWIGQTTQRDLVKTSIRQEAVFSVGLSICQAATFKFRNIDLKSQT